MNDNLHIQLINDDCLCAMQNIPNQSIDLILCDLPYGVTQNKKDICLPFDQLWEQYNRIIKKNGAILLFGQGLFFIDLVNSNRKQFKYDIVWNKILVSGFLNAKRMPLRQHEQIAVFGNGKITYNPQFHEGQPSHSKGTKHKTKDIVNNNYGKFNSVETDTSCTKKYPTSIVSYQKPHPSKAIHPTEKPVELLEYLIKTYSNEGETVLDNCMGSGSTGVAAINTKRRFIGIELDKRYFEIAKERINESGQSRNK